MARYTLYRAEWTRERGSEEQVLHTGLTHAEALHLRTEAEATLTAEPGYRHYLIGRPLLGLRLEAPALTRPRHVRYRRIEWNS